MNNQSLQSQIRGHLLELIQKSQTGAILPTEKMLAEQFGSSRATVQMVMLALVREGFIERRKGRGSFVRSTEKRIFSDSNTSYHGNILYIYPDYPSVNYVLFRKIIEEQALQAQLSMIEMRASRYASVEPIRKLLAETPCLRGVILFSGPVSNGDYQSLFAGYDIPVILIGDTVAAPNVYSLNPDWGRCGRLCMDYLIRCGHRRFVLIQNEPDRNAIKPLSSGMKQMLRELSLPVKNLQIHDCGIKPWENSARAAYLATGEIIASAERPTAFIYTSYNGAVAGLRRFREAGIDIPEEASILVTDSPDPLLGQYLFPRLTYATCPRERVVSAAMKLISGGGKSTVSNILVDIDLSEQESVKKGEF